MNWKYMIHLINYLFPFNLSNNSYTSKKKQAFLYTRMISLTYKKNKLNLLEDNFLPTMYLMISSSNSIEISLS